MADPKSPNDVLTGIVQEVAGRSVMWWKAKLHVYMRQTKEARDALARTQTELADAKKLGDTASVRIVELESRVAAQEADLRDLVDRHNRAVAELQEFQKDVSSFDLNAAFGEVTVGWETELAQLEKEVFG